MDSLVVVETTGGGKVGLLDKREGGADGYTSPLLHNVTFSTTTVLADATGRAKHTFDDFAPVSLAANVPLIVMCHPSVPVKDLKEFVDIRQGQNEADKGVFFGSTGPGSVMHLVRRDFKRDTGIKMSTCRSAAPRRWCRSSSPDCIQLGGEISFRPRLPMIRVGGAARPRHALANAHLK